MRTRGVILAALCLALVPAPARSQGCPRAVVFTLPGVTWGDIADQRPPTLMRLVREGAIASMSVRTNSARTTYASGFATIGGGTRLDGGESTGGPVTQDPSSRPPLYKTDVEVAGLAEMKDLADRAGYDAVPGALGNALGDIPTIAIGNAESAVPPFAVEGHARYPLLAAMDADGVVDRAASETSLVTETTDGEGRTSDAIVTATTRALDAACAVIVVDHGDLIRAEQGTLEPDATIRHARAEALGSADRLLAVVHRELDPAHDLLLVVSPTSPAEEERAHFGVAVAWGGRFSAGASLSSAITRRAGMVTLPDVAPTVLAHLGIERPSSMLGRPFVEVAGLDARIDAALELDRESTFVDGIRVPIWTGYVALQLIVYALIARHLWTRARRAAPVRERLLEAGALALLAFPVTTFLIGIVSGHRLGAAGYVVVLVLLDAAVVVFTWWQLRDPLDRILTISAFTCAVILADLVAGSTLQLNTVFSYSPIVAGRFSGLGNIGFAVLGAAVVLTGASLVRIMGRKGAGLAVAGALFVVTIVIDGAPRFGSDVGGVLAFVPSFGLTWLLLRGKRPGLRALVAVVGATVAAVGLFLVWDLSLPEESRTHLGRFFEDVRTRGGGVLEETIARKVRANLRVFTSTIWTYLVPPLLIFVGWLLMHPPGRWQRIQERYPSLQAGIVGGLILSVIGFAANDSGIVVPAVVLSMLVPAVLIVYLLLEREAAGG